MRGQLRPEPVPSHDREPVGDRRGIFRADGVVGRVHDADAAALVAEHELRVFAGVDASTKRDSTAIVACSYDRKLKKVRLVGLRVSASPSQPLDFEGTVKASLASSPALPTARGPLRSVPG